MGKFIYIERHDLMLYFVSGKTDDNELKEEYELMRKFVSATGIKAVMLVGDSFTIAPEGKR
ncbi:hypothetical protein [Lacticaseibacillus paracasei]